MSKKQKKIFCCAPEVWTKAIGWVQIIGAFLLVLAGIFVAMYQLPQSVPDEEVNTNEDAAFGSALRGAMIFGLAILFIFVGCHFVMTVLLLIGNEQERTGFIWPWIIFSWFKVVGMAMIAIPLFSEGSWLYVLPLMVIAIAITDAFFLYVVHQRLNEIEVRQKRERACEFMAL